MSKMLPAYISEDVKSSGEKKVFQLLKDAPDSADWYVLHSLFLSEHVSQPWGEIDFVVLAPSLGNFCLEVKSGQVQPSRGHWIYTDRFGHSVTTGKNPIKQAADNMFSFRERVCRHFKDDKHTSGLAFCFGLVFPDIEYDFGSFEIDRRQVCDSADLEKKTITDYVRALSKFAAEKYARERWFHKYNSLPAKMDAVRIAGFCRPEIERPEPFADAGVDEQLPRDATAVIGPDDTAQSMAQAVAVSQAVEKLKSFTEEQFSCLDLLAENPRCLFKGAAGTGKTMIALESARRALTGDKRVLVVCYNRILGKWLRFQLSNYSSGINEQLFVGHFHAFLSSIPGVPQRSQIPPVPDEDYFNTVLPRQALDAVLSGSFPRYDMVIIDEGQDLISFDNLNVFNAVLRGGLAHGTWQIFCDFQRQAIFSRKLTADEMSGMLSRRAPDIVTGNLTVNCRNTVPVAEHVALISGFAMQPCRPSGVKGIPVRYIYYDDGKDEAEKLDSLLAELAGQGLAAGNISIISPRSFQNSGLFGRKDDFAMLKNVAAPGSEDYEVGAYLRQTVFYTIQSFKGMENSYIVVIDVESLDEDWIKKLLYVGMSRAKVGLCMLVKRSLEHEVNVILQSVSGGDA